MALMTRCLVLQECQNDAWKANKWVSDTAEEGSHEYEREAAAVAHAMRYVQGARHLTEPVGRIEDQKFEGPSLLHR